VEDWDYIKEFKRYLVSNQGRIKNERTDRIMTPQSIGGHLVVGINEEGQQYKRSVARLVALTFLPTPEQVYFSTPIHLDGELENCWATNLMWKPRWFATQYTRQFRRYSMDPIDIRNVRTGEVMNIWDLVTRDGLLYVDVVASIEERTVIFPTMEQYEWVE